MEISWANKGTDWKERKNEEMKNWDGLAV